MHAILSVLRATVISFGTTRQVPTVELELSLNGIEASKVRLEFYCETDGRARILSRNQRKVIESLAINFEAACDKNFEEVVVGYCCLCADIALQAYSVTKKAIAARISDGLR